MKPLFRQLIFTPFAVATLFSASTLYAYDDWGPTIAPKRTTVMLPFLCIPVTPILTITEGAAFSSRIGSANTLPVIDSSTYSYSPSDTTVSSNIFGVFIGGEYASDSIYATQLGIGYYQTGSFNVNGTVTQGVDPGSSDTYNYSYSFKSQEVLLEGKLLMAMGEDKNYHPYFAFGLGESYNQTGSYSVNYPPFLTFSPIFSNNSTASFAYTLGVGIDVDLTTNWRGGVGYRYANLGNSNFGAATLDTTTINASLQQENVYVSEVVAQLTYLF